MLWIDAICINQADNEEKNLQIPLINRIYFQAERTLVFLGDENRTKITQLFDFLRRRDASGNKAPHPAELTEEQRIQFQGELSWILSLSWFTRVWVLQEMAVCKRSVVMLGAETLDWRSLSFGNIYSLGLNPVNMEKDFPRALQLSHNDRKPIKDLASLLTIARSCSSTDKRDRIYALLGIFKNRENISISVDYNKPVEELYTEVAWQVIEAYSHLELLSEAWTRIENVASLKLEQTIRLRKKILEISLNGSLNSKHEDDKLLYEWVVSILERESPSAACTARCTAMLEAVSSLQAEVDRKSTATTPEENTTVQELAQSAMERVQLFQESLSPFVPTEFHGICENPRFRGIPLAGLPSWVPDYSRHPYLHSLASWNSKVTRLARNESVAQISNSKGPRLRVSMLEVDHVKAADGQSITNQDTARFLLRKQRSSERRTLRPYWVPVRWLPIGPDEFATDKNVPGIQTHDRDRFWETFEPELERSGHGANIDALRRFSTGRTIVLTKDSFAIAPQGIRPGDVIGFVRGASVPFLLRPAESEDGLPAYTLAGECYLHGTKGPKIANDYMDLLGIFKHSFNCTDQQDLPWKDAYLV
ncbi:Heterokaryon incompatibility protein [Lasiodiplodia theobromae]|uniref:Heterokaryon incompatibility protein n=1 Tax=Lasiodiplodia theobromae TaxID=45133 RepID=UPI0015C379A7|nr:Heterokaryon incompatibility protein [Lasiodiplodia theobromae]KAF4536426.1 Heterokaryon incompatibility protein [Lasiodiplodia theobromae]